MGTKQPNDNERIKEESNFLRGRLAEAFSDMSTNDIPADEQQLIKFHGTYLQDDRDLRLVRKREGREKAWSFMLRLRMPGGRISSSQWLALDVLASEYGNESLKLTTRQTVQIHGVVKKDLKPTIQLIHRIAMDTLATCGDVSRNVTASGYPELSETHKAAHQLADLLSSELLPKTRAYHEIWLDEECVFNGKNEEPLYGKTYLPRKFKVGIAVPPQNDIDVFTNDLGFVAIEKEGRLVGYNVLAGGGMGASHGNPATFPRMADVVGFCRPEQVLDVAKGVLMLQRDCGDRTDRKHARLKYTIADHGLDWFRESLFGILGWALEAPADFRFESTGDVFDAGVDTRVLFIEGGRVVDSPGYPLRTALREISRIHRGYFFLTANQNLTIAGIDSSTATEIDNILLSHFAKTIHSAMRLHSIACTSLPTCPLALAEAERFLPLLLDQFEEALEEQGLYGEPIVTRMTGCPNGCARPYAAELGFVGRAPGKYNVWIGGAPEGTRLGYVYRFSIAADDLQPLVRELLKAYRNGRKPGERFGDWAWREKARLELQKE